MVSTDRFLLKKTAAKDAAGFTLIEITMALILLGILAAIAVPKYFDMQEQAAAKKCKYNQSVLLTDMMNRDAIERITADSGFNQRGAEEMASQVLKDQGCELGQPCPSLCPLQTAKSGRFYVGVMRDADEGTMSYSIFCSVAGHASDLTVTSEYGLPLITSFVNYYTTSYKNGNQGLHTAKNESIIETIGDYFTKHPNGQIYSDAHYDDKDANLDYGCKNNARECSSSEKYTSMAELINDSLADQGVNTDQVVWKVTRKESSIMSSLGEGWECTYSVSIANKADIQDNGEVAYKTYQMVVKYGKETRTDGTEMNVIKNIQTLQTVLSGTGMVEKIQLTDGVHYKLK